ncbi:WxL protein peptidoglycan domain-containing protein [Weissella tructae]|uniref:Uncharacterized protein n=2 Tax=Weissella TaxID=46255 RepID=A0A075TZY0_9LACO|nr:MULTISPECIES: DUF916 domain-containing protein [Weissella]AIG65463.1 hypothetical protein WS08_0524 [Weissella tructae]AIM62777.1 hypothetical protein WS74_0525 [Weissella ceti]AIM64112.1 hypothetical protein WS105_0522 [Weissella ceti]QVV91837.1 DUF916 domain-containing protein [Weissella tructae]
MKTTYARIIPFAISLLVGISTMPMINADDATSKGMDFGVRAVKQDNQMSDHTYFDLSMKDGQKQTLPVEISNASDDEMKVKVTVVDATTTSIGDVQYLTTNDYDKAKGHRLTDIVEKTNQTITIPKNDTVTVNIMVNSPKKMYGNILGGIQVEKVMPENAQSESDDEGISVRNSYSYVIGTQLHYKNLPKDQFDFSLGEIGLTKVNYRKKLSVDINNDNQKMISKAKTEVKVSNVRKDGSVTDPILKDTIKSGSFAPMSTLHMPLDPDKIKVGDYQIDVTITQGKQKKHLVKKFHISTEDEKAAEKDSVKDSNINWGVLATILVISLGVFGFIIWELKYKSR